MSKKTETKEDDESPTKVSYLNAQESKQLDDDLMDDKGDYGFTLQQLMELAGLSVASAVMDCVSNKYIKLPNIQQNSKLNVLIICGPGNNGGDGLVCARHLQLFNQFNCTILYTRYKNENHPYYKLLVKQCESFGIKIIKTLENDDILNKYNIIIDGVFGFSFKGVIEKDENKIKKGRENWYKIFDKINNISLKNKIPVFAIDVPSGWNINMTKIPDIKEQIYIKADVLISLSFPKICAKLFKGIHYLGGRFIPDKMCIDKDKGRNWILPKYKNADQVVRIDKNSNL